MPVPRWAFKIHKTQQGSEKYPKENADKTIQNTNCDKIQETAY